MLNYTRIPAPRVTLVDPQTGIVANEWFRFFNNLYTIAYAATGSVTAGTYGSATAVPQIIVDDFGSITGIVNVPIAIDANQIVSGTIASARISGSYTGITGVGTLTVGTWNASAITTPYGGTGLTSYTAGDTLYYATGTTLSNLAIGASTYINTSSGTAPQWTDPATITIGKATNIVGGAANRIAYQTAVDTTGFIVAPTIANTYLEWSGTAFQWTANPLGTVTSVAALTLGTTGTDLSSTVANSTTTPVITLNVPTASATNRGALSAADWTTFNNKGSGSVTSVAASVPAFLSITGSPITTSGTLAITLSGTALPTTSGGTGITSFTANGVVYASSTSALTTGSSLTFNGSNLSVTGTTTSASFIPTSSTKPTNGMFYPTTNTVGFSANTLEQFRYDTANIKFGTTQSGYPASGLSGRNFVISSGAYNTNSSVALSLSGGWANNNTGMGWNIVSTNTGINGASVNTLTFERASYTGSVATSTEMIRVSNSGGVSIGNTSDPGATNLSVTGSITCGALTATSNAVGSVNAKAGGLTAVTAVAGSLTLATGGVTIASQVMASGSVWRVTAYGTYVASSSANARTLTMACYWGATALTSVTTGNVLAVTAQTTPWHVELEITGSSATAAWCTAILSAQVTSATIPLNYVATAASVTGLTTTSTLDFRVGQTGTATAGDTINVHSVILERIK